MKQFLADIAPQAFELLKPVFLAIFAWACCRAANYFKAHTKNLQTQAVLLRLNDAVATAVESVEQTVVANYKDLSSPEIVAQANGPVHMSKAACSSAKSIALDRIQSNLGTRGMSETMQVLGIESSSTMLAILGDKIEAHVLRLPAASTSIDDCRFTLSQTRSL